VLVNGHGDGYLVVYVVVIVTVVGMTGRAGVELDSFWCCGITTSVDVMYSVVDGFPGPAGVLLVIAFGGGECGGGECGGGECGGRLSVQLLVVDSVTGPAGVLLLAFGGAE